MLTATITHLFQAAIGVNPIAANALGEEM